MRASGIAGGKTQHNGTLSEINRANRPLVTPGVSEFFRQVGCNRSSPGPPSFFDVRSRGRLSAREEGGVAFECSSKGFSDHVQPWTVQSGHRDSWWVLGEIEFFAFTIESGLVDSQQLGGVLKVFEAVNSESNVFGLQLLEGNVTPGFDGGLIVGMCSRAAG